MKKRLSIHAYLILFLSFIMFPLVLLSLYVGNRFADQKRDYYLSQSRLRGDTLHSYIQQLMTQNIKLVEMVSLSFLSKQSEDRLNNQVYLDSLVNKSGVFQGFYIADKNGISKYFSPAYNDKGQANAPKNYQDRDYYQTLIKTQKMTISKVQKGKASNKPTVQIAIPFFNYHDELDGLTVGNVHIDLLENKAKELIKDDLRFRIVLTDHTRQLVFDSKEITAPFKDVNTFLLYRTPQANSHYFEFNELKQEMQVYYTAIEVGNHQWGLYVVFPKESIEKEAYEARNTIIIATIVFLFAILFLSYLIALKVSAGTNQMLFFVQQIGQGNFKQDLSDLSLIAVDEGQRMIEALRATVKQLDETTKAKHQAEESAKLSDKMATIGTLVAGIAHEINNPLSYIKGNLDFSIDLGDSILADMEKAYADTYQEQYDQEATQKDDAQLETISLKSDLDLKDSDFQKIQDITDALKEALVGVERVSEIVKSLLSLSRKEQSKIEPVVIKKVVDSCIKIANSEIKKKTKIKIDLPASLPKVLGNESQLGQVILNLVMNAVQAMKPNQVDQNLIEIKAYEVQDQHPHMLCVSVKDNGSGIKPDILSKIFDPFFTTKPVGKGTGLGLSICMNIIQSFNGKIEVESEIGKGTTFLLFLQIDSQPAVTEIKPVLTPMATIVTPMSFEQPKHFRILIVDDMLEVAKGLQRQLSPYYFCEVSDSPVDALKLLEKQKFDCIISDFMMPELNGDLFYEAIQKKFPKMASRIFFVSGGLMNEEYQKFFDQNRLTLLPKPIETERLLKAIKSIQKHHLDEKQT
jgi:signal transduction histidine kinase